MSPPIRVLYVGAKSPTIEARRRSIDLTVVSATDEALERMESEEVDCVLGDRDSVCDGANEFVRAVREREPSLPVVVLTETGGETIAAEAIDAGVTDYHPRPSDDEAGDELANRIEFAVERAETRDRGDDRRAGRDREADSDGDFPFDLERFRSFADAVADPLYVLDDEGYHLLVNDAHAAYIGIEREELVGTHTSEFISQEDVERGTRIIESMLREGQDRSALELDVQRADGEERIVDAHVTVLTDDEGEYVGNVGVIRDVTERKEYVRKLARYETIVETAPIGLLAVDEDGVVVWHNEEFTDDLGIRDRDLIGSQFADLAAEGFFPDATLENYSERLRHLLSADCDDDHLTYEEAWFDSDGEPGVTEVNMGLLPLENGEFAGTVYAFRNITERVRYERELERQNERLENFASFVSHDLRNPLNVAKGHADLLADEYESPHIDEIEWALERIEALIADLLALAREGETVGDPEWFSLSSVAEDAWAAVDTAVATLEVDADVAVSGDPNRVTNLFENLFRNAVEHGSTNRSVTDVPEDAVEHGSTNQSESLSIRVGVLPEDESADPVQQSLEETGFYVEDDGVGLPDDADVFESGYTTNEDGTGLGLAIVREIVDAHGWDIRACEGAAGGARFEIRGVVVDRSA